MMLDSKRFSTTCIRLIFWILLAPLVGCSGVSDHDYLKSAKDYLASQDLRAAVIELKNALQQNPENAESRYLLGKIYLDAGDGASAQKELLRAGEAGWDAAQVRLALAEALLLQNEYDKVLEQVDVEEEYPESVRADLLGLRARAQLGRGELETAEKTLKSGSRLDPVSRQVFLGEVLLAMLRDDWSRANQIVERGLKVYPGDLELTLLNGEMALARGDQEEAGLAFQEVIDRTPSRPITRRGWQARVGLVRLQIVKGDVEAARSTLQPLVHQAPAQVDVSFYSGLVAFQLGEHETAERRLLEVLKVMTNHGPTLLLLGAVNYAQGNFEQAAHYLARYLATTPDNLEARKLLGRTYMVLGQPAGARDILRPALARASGDAELLTMVGLSQIQSGDVDSGIRRLKSAIAAAPADSGIRTQLAKAYLDSEQAGIAIADLEAMVADGTEHDPARVLLVLAYLRDGKIAKAIAAAQDLLIRQPGDPKYLTLMGGVYAATGDATEARAYFERALEINPAYPPAALGLGWFDVREGKRDAARDRYLAVLRHTPESTEAMIALAGLADLENNPEEGTEWLVKARNERPADLRAAVTLVERYLSQKRYAEAEKLTRELAVSYGRQPAVLALQAKVLMEQNRNEEAVTVLNSLVSAAPQSALVHYLQGKNYYRLGDLGKARESFEKVLLREPNHLPAAVLMAQIEMATGRYDAALELGERIRKDRPDSTAGDEIKGNALLATGDIRGARDAYGEAVAKSKTGRLMVKLAETTAQAGNPQEAEKLLRDWLKAHPNDVEVRLSLGIVLQNAGQEREAILEYEEVLKRQPKNAIALNNLAGSYLESGDPRALKTGERAYRVDPKNPAVMDTYGWILVQNGEPGKGLPLLEQAAPRLQDAPEVRYHLAVAKLKSGHVRAGRKELSELLASGEPFEGREDAEKLVGAR